MVTNTRDELQLPGDGSDWEFRMLIADRYKRLHVIRRGIRGSSIAQIIYIVLRSAWKAAPFLIKGAPPPPPPLGMRPPSAARRSHPAFPSQSPDPSILHRFSFPPL